MTDEFDNLIWSWRGYFTQTDVGGGAIKITIQPRERTLFLWGLIGPDNYAADRTVSGVIKDTTGVTVASILYPSPIDNERILAWSPAVAAHVDDQGQDFLQRILLGADDRIVYDIATPAQNEVMTLAIRALIRTWPPTFSTAGSAGTVTTTETFNKVI